MANELKNCPFCGPGESVVECYADDYGYWKVGCGRCGSHSGTRPKSDPDAQAKVIAHWNARPAAPVEGLEVVEYHYFNSTMDVWLPCAFPEMAQKEGKETRELVTRSQSEAIIAAKDAQLVETARHYEKKVSTLQADNAALTARLSEISGHLDCETDSDSILHTIREIEADKSIYKDRAKALETQLAAARKALEPFSKYAGTLFERNFNDPDIINQFGEYRLTAKDFFDARVASETRR